MVAVVLAVAQRQPGAGGRHVQRLDVPQPQQLVAAPGMPEPVRAVLRAQLLDRLDETAVQQPARAGRLLDPNLSANGWVCRHGRSCRWTSASRTSAVIPERTISATLRTAHPAVNTTWKERGSVTGAMGEVTPWARPVRRV